MLLKEKREKRAKAIADARVILDLADKEKRDLSAAETEQYDRLRTESDKLKAEIEADERSINRRSWVEEQEKDLASSAGRKTERPAPGRGEQEETEDRSKRPIDFEIRGMKYRYEPGTTGHRRNSEEFVQNARNYIRSGEMRNLQSDLDASGGYLITPETMVAELIKTVDDEVFVRGLARKFTVTDAASLGVRQRDNKASTFVRGSELGPPTDDTSLTFGKRTLTPTYMTGSIKVSRDLLRMAAMNPEQIVMDELARDAGELMEREYMTGTGANQALGVFTASTDGIPTTRDFSSGNTTTGITFDGLITAKMALKQKYRDKATWLFHRDAVTQIMKLKDAENRYIWEPSTVVGSPDKILNLPYIESEWAPNTFTTGLYVGILADWRWYWIVDQLLMEVQRLNETSARTNQVEFITRLKNDGAPMLAEAFSRVKLA